jgi:hypothetical protein
MSSGVVWTCGHANPVNWLETVKAAEFHDWDPSSFGGWLLDGWKATPHSMLTTSFDGCFVAQLAKISCKHLTLGRNCARLLASVPPLQSYMASSALNAALEMKNFIAYSSLSYWLFAICTTAWPAHHEIITVLTDGRNCNQDFAQ